MTARIIAIGSDEHRAVQALLPWFANGTLAADERQRVMAHIAQCPRCSADAQAQAALRDAAAAVPGDAFDVEHGWASLRARLAPPRPAAPRVPPWWSRFGWPVVASVQAVAVAVLAVVVVTRGAPQGAPYQALGAGAPVAAANALVVFRPEATEQQIRQALKASQARIVDGPTVTDAYLVHMPALSAAALARLGASPAVARVESLQGAAR